MSRYKGIKGKVWDAVKESVRRREKHCYTCGALDLQGINAQSGHYLPVGYVGSNNTLSWDSRQIHMQCARCNGVGQGMQSKYREHLIKDYGEEVVIQMEKDQYKVSPVKDWNAIIEHFKSL